MNSAPRRSKRDPELHDLVPYDYALWRWTEGVRRSPESYRDTRVPFTQPASDRPVCPVCAWPFSQRGFVRMPFPRGHELFGKAICCPKCWPQPFGHAATGNLDKNAVKIKAMWEALYRGIAFDPVQVRRRCGALSGAERQGGRYDD